MTEPVFLRKTSGLVRSARAGDILVYNLGLISVGIAISLSFYFVPGNYPGANLVLTQVVSGILMGVIAFVFWCWTVSIPRSGGAYAFVSRSLGPLVGFGVSFVDALVWLFYNSFAATFLVLLGVSPFFFYLGWHFSRPSLIDLAVYLETPGPLFLVAASAILISGFLLTRGLRVFFRLQRIMLTTAIVGAIVTIIVLWMTERSEFATAFAESYGQSVDIARLPLAGESRIDIKFTLMAAVWPLLSFVGCIFSVNIAGEIQNVRRSQLIGMFGSLVLAILFMVGLSVAFNSAVSPTAQSVIGEYVFSGAAPAFPIQPYFSALAVIVAGSPIWAFLICAGFFAWAFLWIPATITYSSRAVLAWSLDRLAPAALGRVHPTRFTPTVAIMSVTAVNLGLLALFVFVPFFTNLILVLAAMIAWLPIMVGAIVFPFSRPSLFSQSPIAAWTLFGVPVMSIAGLAGTLVVSLLIIMLFRDPVAAGPSATSLGTLGVLFAIALVWYLSVVWMRRQENIDVKRAFTEIPIE